MTTERNRPKKPLTKQERLAKERRRKAIRRKKRIRRFFFGSCSLLLLFIFAFAAYRGLKSKEMEEVQEMAASWDTNMFSDASIPDELLKLASDHEEVREIILNWEKYPEKLLELVVKNPETIDFVLQYPEEKDKAHTISLKDSYKKGTIPLYIQWDKRWGYDAYGNGMIALDGCGPTCLSMVYVGLTGDTSMNPKDMADYSANNGYITEEAATTWDLMTSGASNLGLSSRELSLDEGVIRSELEAGHPIICSMRPGDFTTTGHFIVLTGIAEDGTITVNDPNSNIRSEQTWELDNLMNQMKNLWGFTI